MKLTENMEEYLEALWVSRERGDDLTKISWIAKHLNVAPPSAVEMLRRLESGKYVNYVHRAGVRLTKKGEKVARRIIRNHRLVEILMKDVLRENVDEGCACGFEHHMSEKIADALCVLLKHPRLCSHGNPIPKGRCCR